MNVLLELIISTIFIPSGMVPQWTLREIICRTFAWRIAISLLFGPTLLTHSVRVAVTSRALC